MKKGLNNLIQIQDLKCPDTQLECLLKNLLIKYLPSLISTDEGNLLSLDADGKLYVDSAQPA